MMKSVFLSIFAIFSLYINAQEKLYIHKSDNIALGALISKTDSIYFTNNDSVVNFDLGDTLISIPKVKIDCILFGDNDTSVYIHFNGTGVSVINPLAFEGVTVLVNGADVVVRQTGEIRDINYILSGTTTDGLFKIYSEKRFNLVLNGVNITNADGPAINIQSENKVFVNLADGTNNTLTDGIIYATAPTNQNGEPEDQNAAFFSEGKLVFNGTGSLTINGRGDGKHSLNSDESIEFENGTITIASAPKDGIHAKEGIKILGGNIQVTATGEAIDGGGGYILISGGTTITNTTSADTKGISCDSTMTINGGIVTVNVGGVQSKGLKSCQNMYLTGGTITINATGGIALYASGSGYEPSYSKAVSCDSSIYLNGANIKIISTGIAGKGISANDNIYITSGSVNITCSGSGSTYTNTSGVKDAYTSVCIESDKNIQILGGTVTTSSSGTGGRGINVNGSLSFGDATNTPTVSITTTGTKITITAGSGGGPGGTTGDYAEAKAIKCDGAVTINNGNITIASADDGIKSPTAVYLNNGTVTISNSVEGVESPNIIINNGKIYITASNDGFNSTYSTVAGGTESNDGSCLTVNGGYAVVNATGGDAIDSNGNIVMTGGVVIANGPSSGVEEACDFNGNFNMNGGFFIGSGSSSNMTKAMSSTSTQRNMYISSSSIISSSTLLRIQNSSGTEILTFKPKYGGYKFLFSSSLLTSGATYSIYTGGSYSGGTSADGLYTGGTYSTTGATLKKTGTLSTTSTVNNISF